MPQTSALDRYSEADIDRALQAAAIASGNTRVAGTVLGQAGYRVVPHTTLHRWITSKHQARYRRLQAEMEGELNRRRADEHQALSQAYNELQRKAIELLREKLPEMKANELANAVQRLSISSGIHIDKARLFRNEPTTIERRESTDDILRKLQEKFPGVVTVESQPLESATAVEASDRPSPPRHEA